MANLIPGSKKMGVDRNQRTAMIAVGLAAFVLIFSAFFGLRLYSKQQYQGHVISELKCASKKIAASRENLNNLKGSFDEFNEADPILGRDKQSASIDNSVVVLRALPSQYKSNQIEHFWGLFLEEGYGTGLGVDEGEEGLPGAGDGYSKGSIDFPDSTEFTGGETAPTGLQAVEFTFQIDVQSQEEMDKFFEDLHNFIMPVKILSMDIRFIDPELEDQGFASLNMRLKTYFQTEQNISISKETLSEGSTTAKKCDVAQSQSQAVGNKEEVS